MKYLLVRVVIVLLFSCTWQIQAQVTPQPQADTAEIKVVDTPTDAEIASRLSAVIAAIDGLSSVELDVTAGVVTLKGEVPNTTVRGQLEEIASRVEGVVYVQSYLTENVAIPSRLVPATRKFSQLIEKTLRGLPLFLVSLVVVFVFWLLGNWLSKHNGWLRRIGLSALAVNLGSRVVRLMVTALGILIALEILDATALVSAILGVAGVFGIALGFAFRNIVENYLAGVLLSARNPFDIGDLIQIAEYNGNVVRLTSRDTVLMTPDGNHLRIPNSVIITSAMTNFSRNPLRRFEFNVGVSVDFDLVAARDLGVKTLQSMKGILLDPKPQVLVAELGDSTVLLHFMAWVDQAHSDFVKSRSEAIRMVKSAFDHAGIEMPEPAYRVHLMGQSAFNLHDVVTGSAADVQPNAKTLKPVLPVDPVATSDVDVARDTSIDKQVAAELHNSDEENLLKK